MGRWLGGSTAGGAGALRFSMPIIVQPERPPEGERERCGGGSSDAGRGLYKVAEASSWLELGAKVDERGIEADGVMGMFCGIRQRVAASRRMRHPRSGRRAGRRGMPTPCFVVQPHRQGSSGRAGTGAV